MELFSPMPQEDYTLKIKAKRPAVFENLNLGLGDLINDQALWNYLALTSRLLYKWEDPKVKKGDRPARFPQLENAKSDMEKKVDGVTVRSIMTGSLNDACETLLNSDLSNLSMCDFHSGDQAGLKMIIKARKITMKKSQGKRVSKEEEAIEKMVKSAK